jgi:RNase H-like domain found in reverse transcriptase
MGGVLTQLQNREWKTISFWSKAFSEAKWNYDTSNWELNAVISALKHWRQYLVETNEPFKIWTDHQNLLFWLSPQNLTQRHARWVLTLADYDFTLHHIPGDKNKQADALSQMPQYEIGENNNNQIVILPQLYSTTCWTQVWYTGRAVQICSSESKTKGKRLWTVD